MRDAQVPALGLGTWLLEGSDCETAVPIALELGYRHIDTAQIYGNESEIGAALAASPVDRADVFITTKLWNDKHRAAEVVSSAEASLSRLQTDYVDLLLIHWPVHLEHLEETLTAMVGLVDRGLTRAIGVSNFTLSQFRRAADLAPVVCNQVEYHPFLDQSQLRDAAREAGGVLTAYSPLARGGVLDDDTLKSIGQEHDKTAAQVALRWLLDQEILVVPKATGRSHLQANLDVFDFTLTEEQQERIDNLSRGERLVSPPFAPKWEDDAARD